MAVALGLLAATCFGAMDYLGGIGSRRSGTAVAVVLTARVASVAALLVLVPLLASGGPTTTQLAWGALAGVGAGGALLLYRGTMLGAISVVVPVSAAGSATLPVLTGLALGERPGPLALVGVAASLVAVALVSVPVGEQVRPRAILAGLRPGGATLYGLAAACGFALVFVSLDRAGGHGDLWPVLTAQAVNLVIVALAAGVTHRPMLLPGRVVPLAAAVGLLSAAAMTSYLLAARTGLLSVVAVLASLYPAVAVLLARVLLSERLATPQRLGVGLALAGVTLIAVS